MPQQKTARCAHPYRYRADHGFMNGQRDVHERRAVELGWKRMLAFWKNQF